MYKNIFINNLKKIELKKNNKTPITKWKDATNQIDLVDLNKYNVGIPTGKINNIIVLDIDFKDEGIEEFNKYTEQYGEINTFVVKTPNKGFHYYFLYENSNEATQHLIDECLTNSTKYRNKGLDIRTNGGYIVAPNSSINNVFYEIINDVIPIELPEELALWLLEDIDKEETQNKEVKTKEKTSKSQTPVKKSNLTKNYKIDKYKYEITDEELITFLNKLDKSYLENYTKWLIVLTICKNLDRWEIFDAWCKKSPKNYNYDKNLKMWNANKGLININYLIKRINKEFNLNIKLAERYISIDNELKTNIQKVIINKEKLEFDEQIFNNNEVLIVESDTGTGKTTHIVKQIKKYIEDNKDNNENYKLISIVNLINLSKQQLKTAKEQGLSLISYKDNKKSFRRDNIIICVNSLVLLKYMDDEYYKNKIVFMDEINSFLEGLTHNNLLIPNIKIIYEILIKFVKYAHKIIIADASIKQNVIDLIKKYRMEQPTKIIVNKYKKHKDIRAIRVLDENLFLEKLLERIKNNKFFLFGCDSCSTITKFYNICVEKNKDKADKFILITSETDFVLTDATEQFKDMWVFYSPSILTGVDFSIEEKQDHFIYAKGDSISPDSIYQQSTRNRNIDTLYYYFNSKQHNFIYDSLDYTNKYYKELMNANDVLNNVCRQLNEDDETYIIENRFFDLYCYNEYIKDCFNTNKRIHYEQILKIKGFVLSTEGNEKKLSRENKKEIKSIMLSIDVIDQYLNDTKGNKDFDFKYENLRNLITYFKLKENELKTYQSILTNKFEREHYFNLINLLKGDEKKLLKTTNDSSYEITKINTIENKINIIKKMYDRHKIKYLSLGIFEGIDKINITDDEYKIIKHIFRSKKDKPVNGKELQKLLICMLKHIIGYTEVVVTKKVSVDGKKIYKYILNGEKINFYLKLYKNKDKLIKIGE